MIHPTEYFKYQNGTLCAENVSILDIVKKTQTPVYIYSKNAFLKSFMTLNEHLAPLDHTICFAMKSNSNLAILSLLKNRGAGMDIVSGGELYRAGKIGVPGRNILFSGVGKTVREILEAIQYQDQGIYSFIVESTQELEVLNELASKTGKTLPIAFRFNPDIDAKTHPYISTGLKKNKFGIPKRDLLQVTREFGRKYHFLQLRGMSVHIGSQLTTLKPIEHALKSLISTAIEVENIIKKPLEFLDIGGGLGICYKNETPPSIPAYCGMIKKYLGKDNKLGHPVRLMLEPGRVISGNSGILVTELLYKKKNRGKSFLIIDAAMTDLIRPSLYKSFHEVLPVLESKKRGKKEKVDLVGPVCESSDFLAQDRMLSQALIRGDLLAILSAGAYGFSMASHYNSRPKIPEVLVEDSRFQVIRQRETYDQLTHGESLFETKV